MAVSTVCTSKQSTNELTGVRHRWVFIIEGIPAIICGIISFFWIPNFPDAKVKFLTSSEKQTIVDSLPKTQPTAASKTWNSAQVKALFTDPTFPTFTLIWVCHAIGGWGVGTVLPTVIYELGLTDTAVAQLMTMPAYAFGCSCLVFIGWLIRTKKLISWVAAIGRKFDPTLFELKLIKHLIGLN